MYKRGEIYYIDLDDEEGVGSEQSGSRPAVIIQNDVGNTYSPTVIVATITSSKVKKNIPTHMVIDLQKVSTILCEQIKTVSKNRLKDKMGELSKEDMTVLDDKIKISLGLS
jgi:mRNA interferase MazF